MEQVVTAERAGRRPRERLVSWLAVHSVDLAFAAIIGTWFAYLLRLTADGWFYLDDWGLIEQSGSFEGLFQPFNKHLSLAILVIYRVLAEAFGFDYGPYRTVGLLCLLAVPVSFFWTNRRLLGPPLAAIASLSMLAFTNHELRPATLNHYLVGVGAVGCAAALNRGRRADWVLLATVTLSLSAASGGVAVAVACLIHNGCVRPWRRRWLVVLVPVASWLVWLIVTAGTDESQLDPPVTIAQAIDTATRVAWTPFQHLGLDNPVLSVALLVAFVAYGVWRLRQGLDAASNFLAWSAALTVWSVGLGTARGPDALINGYWQLGEIVYRYQLVALVFVLLAVVPREPIRWPRQVAIATDAWRQVAAAVLVVVAGWAGSAAIGSHVEARADAYERKGWEMRSVLLETRDGNHDRFPPPGLVFYNLDSEGVLSLLDRYGHPQEGRLPLPDPPTVNVDAAAGGGQATVTWTAPAWDGGSGIIGYVVTPYVGFAPQAPRTFDSTATTQTLTDLTNGVTYRFKVQAVNAVGASGYSEVTEPVTPRPH